MIILCGYGKALKRLAGLKGFNSTDRPACPEKLTVKAGHFGATLRTDDKICSEGQKLLTALLSHTAADNQTG